MARTYRSSRSRRIANSLIKAALTAGLAPRSYVLVTTTGRRTGQARSTPVRPVTHREKRYLVAPYGAVPWVVNARADGTATLSRGRDRQHVGLVECGPDEAGPVLKEYIRLVPITRPYFDAEVDDPVDRFIAESEHHPVFRIVDAPRGQSTAGE
ncbi:nitroreductase/quinone reductase family protein [Phytoactinopolyspora halotolerans]|uniref:Nitroreductase family deazaflavin-dependent oxidoreductase n=1 Tax=Phytoactinopolyspora halotolerans TaxID=1981512 RepID=A0A6L9S834_9ACTN|nr:nitroreductase/quinone reductase family protein [Phytoactinopolyspora halotolerans]NEE00754.1 nitroreductase family deazaflavin-dependent oxidoreductase [Phytoactinopolyspora halotolerans]